MKTAPCKQTSAIKTAIGYHADATEKPMAPTEARRQNNIAARRPYVWRKYCRTHHGQCLRRYNCIWTWSFSFAIDCRNAMHHTPTPVWMTSAVTWRTWKCELVKKVSRIIWKRREHLTNWPIVQNRTLICDDKRLLKTQDCSRKPHNHERQVNVAALL